MTDEQLKAQALALIQEGPLAVAEAVVRLEQVLVCHEEANTRAGLDRDNRMDRLLLLAEANQAAITDLAERLTRLQAQLIQLAPDQREQADLGKRLESLSALYQSQGRAFEEYEARLVEVEALGLLGFTETTADRLDNVEQQHTDANHIAVRLRSDLESARSDILDLERRVGNTEDDVRRMDR